MLCSSARRLPDLSPPSVRAGFLPGPGGGPTAGRPLPHVPRCHNISLEVLLFRSTILVANVVPAECRGLDTAYMYTGGQSETILGGLQGWQGVKPLDTKVPPLSQSTTLHPHPSSNHPSFNMHPLHIVILELPVTVLLQVNPWDGKGLGRASVRSQVETCLARLQVDLSCVLSYSSSSN